MVMGYADPFETLFALQRAFENRVHHCQHEHLRADRCAYFERASGRKMKCLSCPL